MNKVMSATEGDALDTFGLRLIPLTLRQEELVSSKEKTWDWVVKRLLASFVSVFCTVKRYTKNCVGCWLRRENRGDK